MSVPKYDVLGAMEMMRQGMLATGQHVKFSNDPNNIPDNSLAAQMARRLLWKKKGQKHDDRKGTHRKAPKV